MFLSLSDFSNIDALPSVPYYFFLPFSICFLIYHFISFPSSLWSCYFPFHIFFLALMSAPSPSLRMFLLFSSLFSSSFLSSSISLLHVLSFSCPYFFFPPFPCLLSSSFSHFFIFFLQLPFPFFVTVILLLNLFSLAPVCFTFSSYLQRLHD